MLRLPAWEFLQPEQQRSVESGWRACMHARPSRECPVTCRAGSLTHSLCTPAFFAWSGWAGSTGTQVLRCLGAGARVMPGSCETSVHPTIRAAQWRAPHPGEGVHGGCSLGLWLLGMPPLGGTHLGAIRLLPKGAKAGLPGGEEHALAAGPRRRQGAHASRAEGSGMATS